MTNREIFELLELHDLSESEIEYKLQNLRQDSPLLAKFIDILDVNIQAVDKNGVTIFYSKGIEKLEGVTEKDVLGTSVSAFYKKDNQTELDERSSNILKALKTGKPVENQHMSYIVDNNRRIDIITNCYPIFFKNRVVAAVSVFSDITKARRLSDKVLELQKTLSKNQKKGTGTQFSFDSIIGSSKQLQDAIKIAKKVAKNLSPVMIQGETGTGKELFAQSVHNSSPVSDGPFVAVNCAAIPDTLMESVLFGTSKGAFTGAIEKPGLFEEAQNGTLFLDEINSMDMLMQSKLLRALQTKTIMRVGSTKSISVNARIISAINDDPREAVRKNQLRSDIYYRLSVVNLVIPPLRERTGCYSELISLFISQNNRIMGKSVNGVSKEVLNILKSHSWPGNVRELEHVIEHAMNLAENNESELQAHHLPVYLVNKAGVRGLPGELTNVDNLRDTLLKYEAEIISAKLKANKGNISKTAVDLNISRQYLQYRIKRLNIAI